MDIFGIKKLKKEVSELKYKMRSLTVHGRFDPEPMSYLGRLEEEISIRDKVVDRLRQRIWKLENPPKYEGKTVEYRELIGDVLRTTEVKAIKPQYFQSEGADADYWSYTLLRDCDIYAEDVDEKNLSLIEKKKD